MIIIIWNMDECGIMLYTTSSVHMFSHLRWQHFSGASKMPLLALALLPGSRRIDGGTPIAGWFLIGKIQLKWMMTGVPPILGNLHIIIDGSITCIIVTNNYS